MNAKNTDAPSIHFLYAVQNLQAAIKALSDMAIEMENWYYASGGIAPENPKASQK